MSTHPRPTRIPRGAAAALAVTAAMIAVAGTAGAAQAAPGQQVDPFAPDFGPNVAVVSPDTPLDEVQAMLDDLAAAQVDAEMSTARHSVLFLPGAYGTDTDPLQARVGYYTEIAGLGASPEDVDITGKLEVYNRCLADGGTGNCLALVNFWRTISNLSLHVNSLGQDGCRSSANFWAVSQAVSMRRLDVSGANLSLMDYCTAGPQYASGGFIADSRLPFVINGSQQQWLTRNTVVGGWSNAVWNQVFSGVEGAPDDAAFPNPPYTTLEETPVSREKPYLFVEADGRYAVRVPEAQTGTRGITWADGETPGRTIPITDFHIAKPGDSVGSINSALAKGKHLLLTPGVYDVDSTINVKRADTVVLGMGHATLTAVDGAVPLKVADAPGIVVAGVTIDAGTVESPVLLQVGQPGDGQAKKVDPANPITLSDVYFRVGGPHIGKADTALIVNSDHVLIDHTWVWRGDHGVEGFTEGVNGDTDRWNTNTGRTGVVVNGDDVTATGPVRRALPAVQHRLERRARNDGALPERAAVRPADPGGLDAARRHARLPRLQGGRRRDRAHPPRRRRLRVQPEQPDDRHRERVRGAGGRGDLAAPHHDGEPQRGRHQPRRERRRRHGRHHQDRRAAVHHAVPAAVTA